MTQGELQLGRALRDDGIRRVKSKNADWFDAAMVGMESFLRVNEFVTVEAFRLYWTVHKREQTTHPSAWSTLGKAIVDRGLVEYVKHVQSVRAEAHARKCPQYRSLLYRAAA